MTDLSPAAQAILDAHDIGFSTPRLCLAAAIRAAADTIEPVDITQDHEWLLEQLLAIAAELEEQ